MSSRFHQRAKSDFEIVRRFFARDGSLILKDATGSVRGVFSFDETEDRVTEFKRLFKFVEV